MKSYKFVFTTSCLSEDSKTGLPDKENIYEVSQLEEFDISTQTKVIAITLRNFIGSIAQRATEGKYFLIRNIWDDDGNEVENSNNIKEKTIAIGHYPIENENSRTEDCYPDIGVLNKLLTPEVVKEIISNGFGRIAIACLTDRINHWDYNFLKASEMFPESFLAIGLEEEDGDIVSQSYSEGEYDTGFVSNEDNKDYYIMNEENSYLKCFSFVFNNPESLK